jgi:hypothetical protein
VTLEALEAFEASKTWRPQRLGDFGGPKALEARRPWRSGGPIGLEAWESWRPGGLGDPGCLQDIDKELYEDLKPFQ